MQNKNIPAVKVFGAIVCLMVAAVIVGGIIKAGSPSTSRAKALDQRRADGMSQASSAVDQYYAVNFSLPASITDIKNSDTVHYAAESLLDPETQQPVEYRVVDATHYELCTSFAFASDNRDGSIPYAKPMAAPGSFGGDDMNWYEHGAGHECRTADASARAPFQNCGVGAGWGACPNGTTCAQLPGHANAICVKTGQECLAAGCTDATNCTIRESFPEQVSCNSGSAIEPTLNPDQPVSSTDRPVTCNLMKSSKTGKMACYGCGTKACVKPGPEWEMYEQPKDVMGIPYSCYSDEKGFCALAQ